MKNLLCISAMALFAMIMYAQPYEPAYAKRMAGQPATQPKTPETNAAKNQLRQGQLRFTENRGQVADLAGNPRPDILFTAQSEGVKLFVTETGLHYQFTRIHYKESENALNKRNKLLHLMDREDRPEVGRTETYRLDVALKGSNPKPKVEALEPGPDTENFFLAHCPEGITGIRNYGKIVLKEVYPGIDWMLYIKEGKLEHDFVVKPGADISKIQMDYTGAETMKLDEKGALQISTPLGSITEKAPYSFEAGGNEVASSYVLEGNTLSFKVEGHKPGATLTIDPGVEWATYYGGSGSDYVNSVATDASGNVYLAGATNSTSGMASGGHQNTIGGGYDAFLVKFNSNGVLQWATYYGGSSNDYGTALSTDASGNIYLSGYTSSTTGISFAGHQNTFGGGSSDAFLVKFDPNGVRQWGTYYGGSGYDEGLAVATDASGNIYISGFTSSTLGVADGGFKNSFGGFYDAFLVKFNTAGVRQWATYYGGTEDDYGKDLATDASGNVYLSGNTHSSSNIASGGHQNLFSGGEMDAFLVKFDAMGVRQWATYYGGTDYDHGASVAIDGSGNVFLAGHTQSTSSIASGGYQNIFGGYTDAYLVKFTAAGTLQWATYYGGHAHDAWISIATDASDNIYLTGYSNSSFGIASGGYQSTFSGDYDAFLVKFNAMGLRQWGTYYGGTGYEWATIALDASANVYMGGTTNSGSEIAFNGHQNTLGGSYDAFLVKFAADCANPTTLYKDEDNDGYSDGSIREDCGRLKGYKTADELNSTTALDCNDNNGEIRPNTVWYKDEDNDGYREQGKTLKQCDQPTGYKLFSKLKSPKFDCDDNNASVHGSKLWFKDFDNDGYSDGIKIYQCDRPDGGYKSNNELIANKGDCDDNDPAIQMLKWYKDYDDDGYSTIDYRRNKPLYQCTRPAGYKLASELISINSDCNDNNATINPSNIWYKDYDNDGYAKGYILSCKSSGAYYKRASDLISLEEDCNDDNPLRNISFTWYKDFDNDGYSDGTIVHSCVRPTSFKSSSELLALSGDCLDNYPSINPGMPEICGNNVDENCNGTLDEGCITWFLDADRDGYGKPQLSRFSSTQPAGYVSNSLDCRDWDATIHPGAIEICDGKDNNCNGKTDEGCVVPFITSVEKKMGVSDLPAETPPEITMKVFPNPAVNEAQVRLFGLEPGKKADLVLSTVEGKQVQVQTLLPHSATEQVTLRLKGLSAGFYIIKAQQGASMQVVKLMVNP